MSDTIFSVRIDEDVKVKFNEIAKTLGINNKEFMEQLISSYELNKSSEESKLDVQSDVKELQHITKRVLDIYINLVERANVFQKEKEESFLKKLEGKDKEFSKLQEDLGNSKKKEEELLKEFALLEKERSSLLEEIKKLKELNGNFESFKVVLQEKITELTLKLEKEQSKVETLKQVEKDKEAVEKQKNELEELLNNYKEEISKLKRAMEEEKSIYKRKEENLKEEYDRNLSFIKDKLDLEKQKEVIAIKEENYEKLSTMQKSYEEKILELIKENNLLRKDSKKEV